MINIRKRPEEAILFVGCLFSRDDIFETVASLLVQQFGSLIYKSDKLPWKFSEYYDDELSPPVFRCFLFFRMLIDPVFLVEAKHITHKIEISVSRDNKRQINLDPGYLTLAKVVLASKKNYSHRIYLGRGIFGEVELFYQDNQFNPMPYTYNDYRDPIFQKIFIDARTLLKNMMKQGLMLS